MPLAPARSIAYEILWDVALGGHSSDLLHRRTQDLSPRDAGLTGELVFGVLRYQRQLDYLAAHFSGRDQNSLDFEVRLALRLGIYQLRYLDRIPRHAAINESVELVKRTEKHYTSGLVNAVLRKVNRDAVMWPTREVELSMPEWLLASWDVRFGSAASRQIAETFLRSPHTYIRVPAGREAEVAELDAEPTPQSGCYRLRSGDAGPFRRQDINSQSIVPLLALEPGQRLLDLCSSPGNKTAQALEAGITVIACDVSLPRLKEVAYTGAALVNLDARQPLPFRGKFDRILLDAPCSGTGTIARNPEIKWRVLPKDMLHQQIRQVQLLANALKKLAPGGRLVYSTCSLEAEENEAVIQRILSGHPAVKLKQEVRRVPGLDPGDGFYAAVLVG
jgi:16S rRNA (cytosine967-C5)-methyltransferase